MCFIWGVKHPVDGNFEAVSIDLKCDLRNLAHLSDAKVDHAH